METRERLVNAGLIAFVKASGGKGLHVVAPLKPKAEWPAVKSFTKAIADAMASDSPRRYVSTITKAKRRGKILVDYLPNQSAATAVAAYSTRPAGRAGFNAPRLGGTRRWHWASIFYDHEHADTTAITDC
jgi:bifunctional non-homologous end joining protein LigD